MVRHRSAQGAPVVLIPVVVPGLTTICARAEVANIVVLTYVGFSLVGEAKHVFSVLATPAVPINAITAGHDVEPSLI